MERVDCGVADVLLLCYAKSVLMHARGGGLLRCTMGRLEAGDWRSMIFTGTT